MNKQILILSIALVLALIYISYAEILIPAIQEKEAEAYQRGIQSIILEQTQTGNIYYYDGEEIKSINLNELKGGINNEQ